MTHVSFTQGKNYVFMLNLSGAIHKDSATEIDNTLRQNCLKSSVILD